MGLDLDCFDDVTPFADELDDPVAVLIQDVFHILIERPGSNIDDPERGIGIEERLSGPFDPTLASHIDAELEKDDRIDVSKTTITALAAPGAYHINIVVQVDGQELGLNFVNDATGGLRVGTP